MVEILTKKLKRAWLIGRAKTIVIGGGVIANQFFRNYFTQAIKKWDREIKVFIPDTKYSTDNAAMIGVLVYYRNKEAEKDS